MTTAEIKEEIRRVIHWLVQVPDGKAHTTIKPMREILLNHRTIVSNGRVRHINSKHVGAGVYEVWSESR